MKNLIVETIYSKYLASSRTIRIYLPKDLQVKCHVLYMHDGQNLFEDKTAYGNVSWGVSETIENLNISNLMVVGIDNTTARFEEYSPWKNAFTVKGLFEYHQAGGNGANYAKFIVEELIPYLEKKYSNIDKNSRFIAGSSMGGLISTYLGLEYPQVFKKVGVFSTASWFAGMEYRNWLMTKKAIKNQGFFVRVGTKESSDQKYSTFPQIYLDETAYLVTYLENQGLDDINYQIIDGGIHHESEWRKQMPAFIKWCLK